MNGLFSSSSTAATYFALATIALCALGWQDIPSQKSLAILPWLALAFFGQAGLASLRSIATHYRVATASTIVLALAIFINSALHGFNQTGMRHWFACIAWLPLASLALIAQRSQIQARSAMLAAFALGLLLAAAVMIVQRAVLHHERPVGINHNVLSGTLALINLCVVFALAYAPKGTAVVLSATQPARTNAWVASAVIAAIFVVVLSAARSPLLAFSVASLVLIALLGHHLRFTAVLIILLSALLIAALGYTRFVEITREIATYVTGDHATSVGGRLDAWRWFSESGFDRAVIGQSPDVVKDSLATRANRWGLNGRPVIEMWHLHNDFLQMTAAYGVLAALSFFAVLGGFVGTALARVVALRNRPRSRSLVTPCALIAAVIMAFVAGLTDSMSYWPVSWVAWSTAIAVLLAMQLAENEDVALTVAT
jgi:O-antigen ligase